MKNQIIKINVILCIFFFSDEICQEDWLEIYNTYKDGTENRLGRYCGMTAPGPVESVRGATGIKILFRTDEKDVYSGFKARYSFETAKSIFGGDYSIVSVKVAVCGDMMNGFYSYYRLR